MIKPKFNRKMPQNAAYFFSAESDEAFKKAHPIGYGILVAVGIAALLFPMALLCMAMIVFDFPNSAWIVLGFIGAFIMGIGLFNIVAAWIGQYLGHFVTAAAIILGTVLIGISILLVFASESASGEARSMTTHYFVMLMLNAIAVIMYTVARGGFLCWLKLNGVVKKDYSYNMKGSFVKYLWYEPIAAKHDLGLFYKINKFYTVLLGIIIVGRIALGWIRVMTIPLCALSIIAYLMTAGMLAFALTNRNIYEHGSPIVLFAMGKDKSIESSLFDIALIAFALGLLYAELMGTAQLWGMELPHL